MSISVSSVVKLYGKQKALNQVSFEINTGEIAAFIGPNGAGKSTMMKIICGFLPPTSGTVTVNGLNVAEKSVEVRSNIGYLPEHNPLYPEMYIKEYLEFAGGIYHVKNLASRIMEIIKLTGLEREQHKKIGTLSKGYKQRVGLAQALIHDPAILILDEPTTGLDPNQIIEIRNLISEAGKSKTILLSTHIMQEVEAICDRIIIINKGEIVANEVTQNIYKHTSQNEFTLLVEFGKSVTEQDLHTILEITELRKIDDRNWLLSNQNAVDFREKVFQFAVEKGNSVLSMQKQEKRLEEIFHELTR